MNFYVLLPISEYISLLIKLHRWEQNWTKSSVGFYRCHYFLYDVWSLKYKIWFMTENIHAFNYYNALQLLPKKLYFGHILFFDLYLKNYFLWNFTLLLKSCVRNQINRWKTPEWAILCHSIAKLASGCNFYSYYHVGDSHGGACLFEHFTAPWLLYVTWGLPFDNCTLCVRIAFMSFVFLSQQRVITSLHSHRWMDS